MAPDQTLLEVLLDRDRELGGVDEVRLHELIEVGHGEDPAHLPIPDHGEPTETVVSKLFPRLVEGHLLRRDDGGSGHPVAYDHIWPVPRNGCRQFPYRQPVGPAVGGLG